jgi:hypothetical protein
MALIFNTSTPPNDTKIYQSAEGTLDGVTFTGTTPPSDLFSTLLNFIKQSEFIVENALFMEWLVAGTDITKVEFPFPIQADTIGLLPAVADGLPPITEDTDFTPPYECAFYYSQTEFVIGTVQFGLRSGVPMFIMIPNTPVNLLKICFNAKWLKTINLIIYP